MALLKNGFSTTVTFADDSGTYIKAISVKIPGLDGGAEIDLTTMHNTTYETAAARSLKKLTEAKVTFAYDTAQLSRLTTMINDNQLVTFHLADGHTWAAWGFVKTAEPSEFKNGERPTMEFTIVFTNLNASDVETGPVRT